MYGRPGIAYVYLVYGMHDCLNVVVEPEGMPAAVLVRAVEPVDSDSAEAMRVGRWMWWRRRQREPGASEIAKEWQRLAALPDGRIASGPGLVAAAFDITRALTGTDLVDPSSPVRIEIGPRPANVVATPRIGIAYADEPWRSEPWRFVDPDSAAVSGARPRGSAS